jgi:hypothetical protein
VTKPVMFSGSVFRQMNINPYLFFATIKRTHYLQGGSLRFSETKLFYAVNQPQ